MNLLEFSIKVSEELKQLSGTDFATHFIKTRSHCFHTYQKGFVTSSSHGIDFYDNVIKFWDNPDAYYVPKDKNGKPIDTLKKEIPRDDYEYNFVRILKLNKANE